MRTLHGNKEIQKKCLTFQLKSKNETYNFHKIEHFLILLNIQNLLTEPYDPKKSKTEINLAVNQFFENKIINEIYKKPSLVLLSKLRPKNKYLYTLKPYLRKFLAKFRLGQYIWEGKKDRYGNRICVLCQSIESPLHIMVDFQGATEIRNKLISRERIICKMHIFAYFCIN